MERLDLSDLTLLKRVAHSLSEIWCITDSVSKEL
jgi:hypothetical protein